MTTTTETDRDALIDILYNAVDDPAFIADLLLSNGVRLTLDARFDRAVARGEA